MVVDMSILTMLVEVASITPTFAKVGSAETSIVAMFILNEYWTFSGASQESTEWLFYRFVRSNIVRWGGAGVALAILHLLTTTFGIWYLLANAIGIGVGVIFNYVFESLITWKIHRRDTNG
jgi:putative flippase GtrA